MRLMDAAGPSSRGIAEAKLPRDTSPEPRDIRVRRSACRRATLPSWTADGPELERLEVSAHAHFESAWAWLTLDPAGARLTASFEYLTRRRWS